MRHPPNHFLNGPLGPRVSHDLAESMKHITAILAFAPYTFAAPWSDLPSLTLSDVGLTEMVEADYSSLHPWKASQPLPTSFEEAGLTTPVRLVATKLHLDGGSRFYLLKGSNDKFLMICTEPEAYHDKENNGTIEVAEPKIFIGAAHISSNLKKEVPLNSETEIILLDTIRKEVDRIRKSRSQSDSQGR